MSEWNAETAEWYAKNYGDYPTNRLGIDALELPEDSQIVDIGCGTGAALRHAAEKIKGGKLIGVDPVARMLEIAHEWTENHSAKNRIEFRAGSTEALPVEGDFADYALAFDSVDHWEDVDRGLKEVRRILQTSGKFVIIKDSSVPGAKQALDTLISGLETNGFVIRDNSQITAVGISFYLLICEIEKP